MSNIIRIGEQRGGVGRAPDAVEATVRAELKQMDSLLDIRWFPSVVPLQNGAEGRYALVCQWPQQDDRWQMYHDGEIGEPFDILGWFTEAAGEGDFHTPRALPTDPLELLPKVKEFLGRMDNSRHPWKDRMRKMVADNETKKKQVRADAADDMLEGLKDGRKRALGEPVVNLSGTHPTKPGYSGTSPKKEQ